MLLCYLRLGLPADDTSDVCRQWWESAAKEPWCTTHPALQAPQKTIPLMLHGDEGTGVKKKPVLVLSVGTPLTTGDSFMTKFPCCLIAGKLMCAETKLELQEFLSRGFNKGFHQRTRGYRSSFCGTKGDWKFHFQMWPESGCSFTSEEVCLGCRAATTCMEPQQ